MKKLFLVFVIPTLLFVGCEKEPLSVKNTNYDRPVEKTIGGDGGGDIVYKPLSICGNWDQRTKTCVQPYKKDCYCPIVIYGAVDLNVFNIIMDLDKEIDSPMFFKENYVVLSKYLHEKHIDSVITKELSIVFNRDKVNNTLYFVFSEIGAKPEDVLIVYHFVLK